MMLKDITCSHRPVVIVQRRRAVGTGGNQQVVAGRASSNQEGKKITDSSPQPWSRIGSSPLKWIDGVRRRRERIALQQSSMQGAITLVRHCRGPPPAPPQRQMRRYLVGRGDLDSAQRRTTMGASTQTRCSLGSPWRLG
jgi:hypothetical protein